MRRDRTSLSLVWGLFRDLLFRVIRVFRGFLFFRVPTRKFVVRVLRP